MLYLKEGFFFFAVFCISLATLPSQTCPVAPLAAIVQIACNLHALSTRVSDCKVSPHYRTDLVTPFYVCSASNGILGHLNLRNGVCRTSMLVLMSWCSAVDL